MEIIPNKFSLNGLPRNENHVTRIVVHHADSTNCTIDDIQNWHLQRGFSMVGYHYFIRKDGSIYQGRPEDCRGAHCPDANYNSIGICCEGNFEIETMGTVQLYALVSLIEDINSRYGKLPIYKHSQLFATNCPGKNFPFDGMINLLNTEVDKMKEIVLYYGDGDIPTATLLMMKKGCPMMNINDYKNNGYKADKIYQVGGQPNTDRFQSAKQIINEL